MFKKTKNAISKNASDLIDQQELSTRERDRIESKVNKNKEYYDEKHLSLNNQLNSKLDVTLKLHNADKKVIHELVVKDRENAKQGLRELDEKVENSVSALDKNTADKFYGIGEDLDKVNVEMADLDTKTDGKIKDINEERESDNKAVNYNFDKTNSKIELESTKLNERMDIQSEDIRGKISNTDGQLTKFKTETKDKIEDLENKYLGKENTSATKLDIKRLDERITAEVDAAVKNSIKLITDKVNSLDAFKGLQEITPDNPFSVAVIQELVSRTFNEKNVELKDRENKISKNEIIIKNNLNETLKFSNTKTKEDLINKKRELTEILNSALRNEDKDTASQAKSELNLIEWLTKSGQ